MAVINSCRYSSFIQTAVPVVVSVPCGNQFDQQQHVSQQALMNRKVDNMSKRLIIILGPHAVGKMTVGQELAKITNLRLFHNHMSIELSRKLFSDTEQELRVLNGTIRQTVFELFAKGDFPGLIFTYMFAFDRQSEYDYLNNLIELFKSNGAHCCIVELCADFEERIIRNRSENEMRKTSEKYRLNSYDGEILPFENYLKIDNTALSAKEVAKMIQTHFAIADD